jgi:hypothetical protein
MVVSSHHLSGVVFVPQWQGDGNITCNADDSAEAYSNPSAHTRISDYTSMARSVHGPEYDPTIDDIDAEVVMRVGGGKKHGRFWLGDGIIDATSTLSLSQLRAQCTNTSLAIRPWPRASQHQVDALHVIHVLLIVHSSLQTLNTFALL